MSRDVSDAGRRPVRLPSARPYAVGDELLIYTMEQRGVVALNPSARVVWDLCDGGSTVAEIAELIAEGVGDIEGADSRERILKEVEATVVGFAEQGIVSLENGWSDGSSISEGGSDDSGRPGVVLVGLLGHTVVIECRDPETLSAIEKRFRFLRHRNPGAVAARFSMSRTEDGFAVQREGSEEEHYGSLSDCLHLLEGGVAEALSAFRRDLIWFHAGAVARRGRVVLLAGNSGAGKSSMVTELCRRGWSYLSDEIVPIDGVDLEAHPYPVVPFVRQGGLQVPEEELFRVPRTEVDLDSLSVCSEPTPLGSIVFPAYGKGSQEALVPCSPAEAALALISRCQNFQVLGETAVRWIARTVGAVPAYRLTFENREAAADMLAAAMSQDE